MEQKVPYVYFFENLEVFASCKRVFNKLSNDTDLLKIELLLLNIWEKDGIYFLLFSIYFQSHFV